MLHTNKVLFFIAFSVILGGCSKLNEDLKGTITSTQAASSLGSSGVDLLLKTAYTDLAVPFHDQARIYSLEENTTDESLVVTRGGDWDDNGVWRVLHNHTWNASHDQLLQVFNLLNKINFDATNVLNFKPNKNQEAEARFLRALALYQLLDLYGQYPIRDPGENLLNAPQVKTGADAINFIISELTASLPNLKAGNPISLANPDAAKVLLMKCYLQRGAFLNRAAPTFDAADMQQVITLGNQIISSGRYSYSPNYFDNFNNRNDTTKEGIFAYPNTSGVSVNHGAIESRWNHTLHYNSYTQYAPNAGWNGFATISDFYNTFSPTGVTTYGPADTLLDKRIGGRYYKSATDISGIRPGFLVGQQYDENGVAKKDRKGNPLSYTPVIAADMIEKGTNLEVTGIRVVKYVPDYSDGGKNYQSNAGNWLMIFRYPDVVLMVAEAKMRTGDAAGELALVNGLRQVRGATMLTAPLPLANLANVDDPNTLLAERGRELWHESVRRTDMIRFGVFLKPWGLKPADDAKNLVFPIPSQALAANPNLKQNNGYN